MKTLLAYLTLPSGVSLIALLESLEQGVPNWGTLGVGGGLALVMFWFYREDRKRSEAAMKEVADKFERVTARLLDTLEKRGS